MKGADNAVFNIELQFFPPKQVRVTCLAKLEGQADVDFDEEYLPTDDFLDELNDSLGISYYDGGPAGLFQLLKTQVG